MKNYVSYVVQGPEGHNHFSETLKIDQPSYSYSKEPETLGVMEWAAMKQKELSADQKLVIVNVFKL